MDELCDLTLDKIVDKVNVGQIPKEIDKNYIKDLKKQLVESAERLKKTNPQNYKDLMKAEAEGRNKKPSIFRRILNFFMRK